LLDRRPSKPLKRSIGKGKTIVEFFSLAMS
jgi:hypothetical protein